MGDKVDALAPATTITSSVTGCNMRIAAERKVPLRQGSSALSRPMRVDEPAARTTPANEGDRGMVLSDIVTFQREWSAGALACDSEKSSAQPGAAAVRALF